MFEIFLIKQKQINLSHKIIKIINLLIQLVYLKNYIYFLKIKSILIINYLLYLHNINFQKRKVQNQFQEIIKSMYEHNEQQYMSQPIDNMSQSSYIRINKKFLEDLKTINQIQDLSRYRQESEDEENERQQEEQKSRTGKKVENQQSQQNQHDLFYSKLTNFSCQQNTKNNKSKHQQFTQQNHHKFAQDNKHISFSPTNKNTSPKTKNLIKNYSQQLKNHFQSFLNSKLFKSSTNQNLNKIENSIKKQKIENTYDFYLMNENQQKQNQQQQKSKGSKNYSPHRFHILDEQQQNSSVKMQLFTNSSPNKPTPYNNSKNLSLKSQIQRINYRKLLQTELTKNKQLQRQIYKLQTKQAHLNLQHQESLKYIKKLEKQLNCSQKIRKENKNKMKQLDGKLEGLKNLCKVNKYQKNDTIQELRRQNKAIKEELEKYRVFTSTLSQSIFVLKGKKPKKLEDIWEEWKVIFQSFSKNKWKSPKSKTLTSNLSHTKLK